MKDLLKGLRRRLTMIATIITTIILVTITSISFFLCQREIRSRNKIDLENEVQSVINQLQGQKMISQDWLADQEQKNDSIISISENNTELLYHGVKSTITPRKMILEEAEKIARERYLFNVNGRGIWFEKNELSGIEMRTKAKEHYIFTISIVDVLGVNYKIIILRDLRSIDAQIVKLGILLTGLNVVGIILLYLFSFWFSGKAIKPIKESRQKQNEFIAAVSHELKSPLAVLQTNSSALRYKDSDEQEYLITSIENECQRMSRLVQDLLQLASMDAGSWSIQLGREIDRIDY